MIGKFFKRKSTTTDRQMEEGHVKNYELKMEALVYLKMEVLVCLKTTTIQTDREKNSERVTCTKDTFQKIFGRLKISVGT